MKKYLVLFIFFICTFKVFSQNPNYQLVLKNDLQISANEYEFDIVIRPLSPTTSFELASIQCIMTFNTGIGSNLSFVIVAGSSQLVSAQQPNSSSISGNELQVPARTPPAAGNGTIVNVELKVARFKLSNDVAFNLANANILWKNAGSPRTIVLAYVSSVNTDITNSNNHLNELSNQPLPVELSSFTASTNQTAVNLKWQTKTEIDNYGFEVERKIGNGKLVNGGWEKIGFISGNGNSNSPNDYSFTDKNPIGGSKFVYRLKQIDNDGKFKYSDQVEIELVPNEFNLFQNYPNPFNPATNIKFALPKAAKVTLLVYNLLGEKVATLLNEDKEAGFYNVQFNANSFSSGVYIFRLTAGDFVQTKKMTLMK